MLEIIKKINTFFWKVRKFFINMSNFQKIFFVYLFTTLFATILLYLPFSQQIPGTVSFIDAMFVSASAFSDTGLTTVTTATVWSSMGQAIIAILILLGGIGIFALKVYIVNVIFMKPISIHSKNILEKERGASNIGELKRTIKISISFLFITIIFFSLFILWPIFYFESGNFIWTNGHGELKDFSRFNPQGNLVLSFKCAIFHSITAINNAGFDILSDNSLYPYYHVYSIQIAFIVLTILGGIGYPLIYDVICFIQSKLKRRTDFKFSLFSKVNFVTYFLVSLVGMISILIFEIGGQSKLWTSSVTDTFSDRIMCMIFHVFSTRSTGFTTIEPTLFKFSNSSLIILAIMMFIGGAPSSTAGGMRTTTLAIIFIAIWNKMRGVNSVRVFKRRIESSTVYSSFIVFAVSITIVLIVSLICSTSFDNMWGNVDSQEITFADIFYDVCSAFGTTGLSTGMVSGLNSVSKIAVILTMFIGQLGISSTMLVWRKNNHKNNYSYITENILIG